MSETTENLPVRSEQQSPGDFILYENAANGMSIVLPHIAPIPTEEGITASVEGKSSPLDVLGRMLIAEGMAKIFAESGFISDLWANTQVVPESTKSGIEQRVFVFSRNSNNPDSQRKPVHKRSPGVAVDYSAIAAPKGLEKLQRLSHLYLPLFEKLGQRMQLTLEGMKGEDVFVKTSEGYKIWESKKFYVEVITENPHLKGTHVVVRPKKEYFGSDYTRQWQTVLEAPTNDEMNQKYLLATLELMAIALGVREKLDANKTGQIHISGNWFENLRLADEIGGKISLDYLTELSGVRISDTIRPTMQEIQKHLTYIPNQNKDEQAASTGTRTSDLGRLPYPHLYIPKEGTEVTLPDYWKGELEWLIGQAGKIKDGTPVDDKIRQLVARLDPDPERAMEKLRQEQSKWSEILPQTEADARDVASKIHDGKLTQWLETNCKGTIISRQ